MNSYQGQNKVVLEQKRIENYVRQLFRRFDFPDSTYITMEQCEEFQKGEVVWPYIEFEAAHNFVPVCRIDQLILNLPSKEEVKKRFGVQSLDDLSLEEEARFWDNFSFEWCDYVNGLKILWE